MLQSRQSLKVGAYWAGILNGAHLRMARTALSAMGPKAGSHELLAMRGAPESEPSWFSTILILGRRFSAFAEPAGGLQHCASCSFKSAPRASRWLGVSLGPVALGAPSEAVRLISRPV